VRQTRTAGLPRVISKLNREIRQIEGRTGAGMLEAGKFIEGESNELAPMEFGVLVNSSFTKEVIGGRQPIVAVGYTAEYAPFVHEMPATNNFTKPGSGPKFLERAAGNTRQILAIIARRAKF